MSELEDIRIDGPTVEPPSDPPEGGRRGAWPLLVILAVVVVGALAWFLWPRPAPPPEVAPTASATPEAGEQPAARSALELPALDQSDGLVRQLAAALSSAPQLARWLATDDLVRRFVASVDNIATGRSPRPHLLSLDPGSGFSVLGRAGGTVLDPASYGRYDPVADAFAALDVEGTARLYRDLHPLLDQAYADLGYPGRRFDATLARAVENLLATPVVAGDVALETTLESYHFADPQLEALSPAQKHLLRMGPENTRRIQQQLRRLAAALELPVGR